jgi:hypothetical protein
MNIKSTSLLTKVSRIKEMRKELLAALLLCCVILPPNTASALTVTINPEEPTTSDFIIAEIAGSFPTPGYEIPADPIVEILGNAIEIDVFAFSLPGIWPQVVTPFIVEADIGNLAAGQYPATAYLNIDGMLVDSGFTHFNVVPVPAAVWLFGSGLLGLIGVARRKAA